ncbi:hypothetical protein PsorP6_003255 [Peronosclerospora sorghi]|uniref:Uncharacterized protein n=1 Tax=Peronosclerospora sorghi TaxID=230839 RepID=A0ACC0VMG6_9STRA|nr:hypothetical protein PsorP6_003255 [Peronosclerospora sorghi]
MARVFSSFPPMKNRSPMTKKKTLLVAGAGVVGLAIARAGARRGLDVILLEKNALVGQETSARNSEVIHAGLYYGTHSFKARLCVQGRAQLYDFCTEYHVPFARCGKLLVAHAHQSPELRRIFARGVANGVHDLQLLSRRQVRALEPQVDCHEAIFSPSTGILDSHAFLQALQGDAEAHGALVARATAVVGGNYNVPSETFVIHAANAVTGDEEAVESDYFVNATGLWAPSLMDKVTVSGRAPSCPVPSVPTRFAKGTYFRLPPPLRPFSHLVYPIPEAGGLGVHATLDLDGNVRFGPDVEWVDTIDYDPDPLKAETFAQTIRAYWPHVRTDLLHADYCGIRPKVALHGNILDDFYIADVRTHGVPGLVHLCGIESPGLTASLAIADTVIDMLEGKRSNNYIKHVIAEPRNGSAIVQCTTFSGWSGES